MDENSEYLKTTKEMPIAYRTHFPKSEEIAANGLQEGGRYTVSCGEAAGAVTTVRAR